MEYKSLDEATEAIKHGTILGVLYMSENFTKSYEDRVNISKSWTYFHGNSHN